MLFGYWHAKNTVSKYQATNPHNAGFCNICLQLSEACLPVHEHVRLKICELFRAGVRRVSEYRTLLDDYVRNALFSGQPTPPLSDARFWPSNRYILGCISRQLSKSRFDLCYSASRSATSCFHYSMLLQQMQISYFFDSPATVLAFDLITIFTWVLYASLLHVLHVTLLTLCTFTWLVDMVIMSTHHDWRAQIHVKKFSFSNSLEFQCRILHCSLFTIYVHTEVFK